VVTEYLIKYCELIFSENLTSPQSITVESITPQPAPHITPTSRPKSLAVSSPASASLLPLENVSVKKISATIENAKYIEVGGGPDSLPQKYHTVIDLPGPGKKGGSFKHKKSTPWKSIFSGKEKTKSLTKRKISTPAELHLLGSFKADFGLGDCGGGEESQSGSLRPIRSAGSLVPEVRSGDPSPGSAGQQDSDVLAPLETVTSAVSRYRHSDSPKCHSRSSSHDSYFERKKPNSVQS